MPDPDEPDDPKYTDHDDQIDMFMDKIDKRPYTEDELAILDTDCAVDDPDKLIARLDALTAKFGKPND